MTAPDPRLPRSKELLTPAQINNLGPGDEIIVVYLPRYAMRHSQHRYRINECRDGVRAGAPYCRVHVNDLILMRGQHSVRVWKVAP